MSAIEPPAPRPCESCPYRTDVPSGVWSESEYVKLPQYDSETPYQSSRVFQCHQTGPESDKARLCAGWVACHGSDLLALRLAAARGDVDSSVLDYETEVPVFDTGAQAAAHGMRDILKPGKKARKLVAKISRSRPDVQYR